MGNAQTFLERLRAERERRLAKNKEAVSGESREFLLTENLPEGNKLWWPSEDTEVTMHILPFMVGKKDNIAEEEVGHFAIVRKVKIHFLPNRAVKVCPETYGHTCPLCEKYRSYAKDERSKKGSPATKYKAKELALFNALFKVPGKDGKNRLEVRVVRGGAFAGWESIMKEIKGEAAIKANAPYADKIYMFDDLVDGYWMNIRCNKASIAGGSGTGDASFMQFTRVNLLWKEKSSPIPEAVIPRIADIDMLIPPPATADELRSAFDMKEASVTEAEEEEFESLELSNETLDEIDCGPKKNPEPEPEAEEIDDLEEMEEEVKGEVEEEPKPEPEPKKKAEVKRKPAKKVEPEPEPEPEPEVEEAKSEDSEESDDIDPFGDDEFDL